VISDYLGVGSYPHMMHDVMKLYEDEVMVMER
jgi:hypothetical protein